MDTVKNDSSDGGVTFNFKGCSSTPVSFAPLSDVNTFGLGSKFSFGPQIVSPNKVSVGSLTSNIPSLGRLKVVPQVPITTPKVSVQEPLVESALLSNLKNMFEQFSLSMERQLDSKLDSKLESKLDEKLKQNFLRLDSELDFKLSEKLTTLNQNFSGLDPKRNQEFLVALNSNLDQKFTTLVSELGQHLKTLDSKMNKNFKILDHKLEILRSDMKDAQDSIRNQVSGLRDAFEVMNVEFRDRADRLEVEIRSNAEGIKALETRTLSSENGIAKLQRELENLSLLIHNHGSGLYLQEPDISRQNDLDETVLERTKDGAEREAALTRRLMSEVGKVVGNNVSKRADLPSTSGDIPRRTLQPTRLDFDLPGNQKSDASDSDSSESHSRRRGRVNNRPTHLRLREPLFGNNSFLTAPEFLRQVETYFQNSGVVTDEGKLMAFPELLRGNPARWCHIQLMDTHSWVHLCEKFLAQYFNKSELSQEWDALKVENFRGDCEAFVIRAWQLQTALNGTFDNQKKCANIIRKLPAYLRDKVKDRYHQDFNDFLANVKELAKTNNIDMSLPYKYKNNYNSKYKNNYNSYNGKNNNFGSGATDTGSPYNSDTSNGRNDSDNYYRPKYYRGKNYNNKNQNFRNYNNNNSDSFNGYYNYNNNNNNNFKGRGAYNRKKYFDRNKPYQNNNVNNVNNGKPQPNKNNSIKGKPINTLSNLTLVPVEGRPGVYGIVGPNQLAMEPLGTPGTPNTQS